MDYIRGEEEYITFVDINSPCLFGIEKPLAFDYVYQPE
jgi:hypothetical protein